MKSSKALDIHTVAQHVRQRALKNSFRPQEKLLISPTERDILRDARNTMFTPSPQIAQDADHLAEDSDEEDPGDGVSDAATLALWGKYLDEVFQDEELDIVYTEAGTSLNSTCVLSKIMKTITSLKKSLQQLSVVVLSTFGRVFFYHPISPAIMGFIHTITQGIFFLQHR
ncbi:hypothetical protein GQ600_27189 [Phytophthora cactorum]|nr:hypothetical protein GQ600_27189 [Phytophthora cactorum]